MTYVKSGNVINLLGFHLCTFQKFRTKIKNFMTIRSD